MAYQSPIYIDKCTTLFLHQPIYEEGENNGAIFDASSRIFVIQDPVYITIGEERYRWIEYHFHIPAEHIIEGHHSLSEIHYVFKKCVDDDVSEASSIHWEPRKNITVFHQEILLQEKVRNWNTPKRREGVRGNRGFPLSEAYDICSCAQETKDILVIGRTIKDHNIVQDLAKVQIKTPSKYFEYDGTLTTGLYSPVRWIIGQNPIQFHVNDIVPVAKSSRPIQPFDNRIILYCLNCGREPRFPRTPSCPSGWKSS